jgi:cob(I)alamin adenosyltransferase
VFSLIANIDKEEAAFKQFASTANKEEMKAYLRKLGKNLFSAATETATSTIAPISFLMMASIEDTVGKVNQVAQTVATQ